MPGIAVKEVMMQRVMLFLSILVVLGGALTAQVPDYEIGVPPVQVVQSWYNYMPSGYYDLPLFQFPLAQGGGASFIYHACVDQPTAVRRIYTAYFNSLGQPIPVTMPWQNENRNMGFPSLAFDPTINRTLYSWHENSDTDTANEVVFVHESDPIQNPGLFSNRFVVFDPPSLPPGHENDEFLWPSIKTGTSPTPGMRRVYILTRNYSHTANNHPGTNVLIAYADYDSNLLSANQNLAWNYTSIPQLDAWQNSTGDIWRRFFGSFAVGNDGKIYLAGYHTANDENTNEPINEPELDVFVCDNYGAGTWQHYAYSSKVPSYNPWDPFAMRHAFYYQDPPAPVPDEEIYQRIVYAGHNNLMIDAAGRLHFPGVWALNIGSPTSLFYETGTVKEFIFDPQTHEFSIHEVFPVAASSSDNLWWQPWDADGNGSADSWPLNQEQPDMVYHFPYCYWDMEANSLGMIFYNNYVRISGGAEDDILTCLWQDSYKARRFNLFPADFPEYAAYADNPEIYLSISADNGSHWSEPIIFSAVDTPELSGMTPMWVYPSENMLPVAHAGATEPWKRLSMMFTDDNNWGAVIPPTHEIDYGNIKYMALDFEVPTVSTPGNEIPSVAAPRLNAHPNPFAESCVLDISLPSRGLSCVSIYNLRGQLVRKLQPGDLPAGDSQLNWDGKDESGQSLPSGVYFARLETGGKSAVRRLVRVK